MKSPESPIEVKRGSVTVRIRRVCPSKRYPDYFVLVLDYHEDGKRQRPFFATLKEARKGAEEVAETLARGRQQEAGAHWNPVSDLSASRRSRSPPQVSRGA